MSKVQSDVKPLTSTLAVVILVHDEPTPDGKAIVHKSDRYMATLLNLLDAEGVPLTAPFTDAAKIRVALSRANDDAQILEFVRQLPAANLIYILPAP